MRRHRAVFVALWGLALVSACGETDACEDAPGAQVLEDRVPLTIGDSAVIAEVARTRTEQERGWARRQCGMDALVLVSDGNPLPVWTCQMEVPIDIGFVRDGVIVAWFADVAPCPPPCAECPVYGAGLPVDAVVELPSGAIAAGVGTTVAGTPTP